MKTFLVLYNNIHSQNGSFKMQQIQVDKSRGQKPKIIIITIMTITAIFKAKCP